MKYRDRDLSWLSFNDRILQEVKCKTVPLMERLKFIAIYSSNLEEFYKVRVASHRFEQKYNGDIKNKFGYRPSYILQQINSIVSEQQEQLGNLFYDEIIPGMAAEGIHLLHGDLTSQDEALVSAYYDEHIQGQFELLDITDRKEIDLKNQAIYLYFIWQSRQYLLELDYIKLGRFITIRQSEQEKRIIQLDDIFRYNVYKFLGDSAEIYAVKISRDAELYIDAEQDEHIVKKIKKSLKKRETGLPCRLLFNENIPFKYINNLRKKIGLDMTSLIPGGKYHNFYDFFGFPIFPQKTHLYYPQHKAMECPRLIHSNNWYAEINKSDIFFSYPYQEFRYVPELLMKAAKDEAVEEINITLYRVNKTSEICQALEVAAQNGKKVFVLAEVLARFDEESNIYWGERLEKAGATVKYEVNGLKVHAKVFSIKRQEDDGLHTYAYLGTGNLNEKTAQIYADHGILTSDKRYTNDLDQVFKFLKDEVQKPKFKNLLVAPFVLRNGIYKMIDREIQIAKNGGGGKMYIKLNSLEDPKMIDKLRLAAESGVKINMVVRGICCYYPQNDMQKSNIKIVSVVDKFLEHTRIYHFNNNGESQTYLASADWMTRNLSRRIEVAFPVFDAKAKQLLLKEMKCQLTDGLKGRYASGDLENEYVSGSNTKASQEQMVDLVNFKQ